LAPGTLEIIHNLAIIGSRTGDRARERELWSQAVQGGNERLKRDPESGYLKAMIIETHKYFGGELLPAEKEPKPTALRAREGKGEPSTPPPKAARRTTLAKVFDSFQAQKELGLACMDRRNWAQAIAAFEKCAAEKPDDDEVQNHLGWAYLNSGDVDGAFRVWNRALKSDPSNKETRDNLIRGHLKVAKHLEKQRVWGPCLVHLKSVLSLDPKNLEVFVRLGNVYMQRGDALSAIEQWQKALELDPKNKDVRQAIRKAKQQMR